MGRRRAKILFVSFWSIVWTALIAVAIVSRHAPHLWVFWIFCGVYTVIFVRGFKRARHRWLSLPTA